MGERRRALRIRDRGRRLRRRGRRALETFRLWRRMKRRSVRHPLLVIQEARREDVPIWYALALLQKETGIPQRNVFGCDHGEGKAFCHERVTRDKVNRLLASDFSNGVGWTQLTYKPFVEQADNEGGAHRPRYQCRIGFRLLRDLREREGSWQQAHARYNGSGPASEQYGREAVEIAREWKRHLGI